MQEIQDKLKQFQFLTTKQKELKLSIATLKNEIIEGCFKAQSPDHEGTEKIEVAGGIVKAVFKLTRKVIFENPKDDLAFLYAQLGGNIMDRLIKTSYSISVAEYKRLSQKEREVFDNYVESKQASPSLEVEINSK